MHPLGGMDLQRGHFLVKMYAKTKELGPIGGACAGHAPLDPPMLSVEGYIGKINYGHQRKVVVKPQWS